MMAKVFSSDAPEVAYEQLKKALGPGWLPGLCAVTGLSANGVKSMLRAGNVDHPKWRHVTDWLEARQAERARAEAVLTEVVKPAA